MNELVTTIIMSLVSAGGASWVTHFITKKKFDSEVDSSVIDNLKKSLDFYKDIVDNNKANLKDFSEQIRTLEGQNAELKAQNEELKRKIEDLTEQVKTLTYLVQKEASEFKGKIKK